MKKSRLILTGKEARKFCDEQKIKNDGWLNWPELVGGWWAYPGGWVAFDTTAGETFIEEFSSEAEAIKYASGELATTIEGITI